MVNSTIFHGTKYSFDKSKLIFVGFTDKGLILVFEAQTVEITIAYTKDRQRQYDEIISIWKSHKGDAY